MALFMVSCASQRSTAVSDRSSTAAVKTVPAKTNESQPRFLENISITPGENKHSKPRTETVAVKPELSQAGRTGGSSLSAEAIEKCRDLHFKYSILMDEPVETLHNNKLILFLENWYGTPYRFGGTNKSGIDCSAFSNILMDSVFNVSIPRTARHQYATGRRISKRELKEGDLVFFNTRGGVSHVGVYLTNTKFVHASASSGVMISDLEEPYFKKRYIGSTRVR